MDLLLSPPKSFLSLSIIAVDVNRMLQFSNVVDANNEWLLLCKKR